MTRTKYYCAATLDGYIADADDGLDWLMGYEGTYEHPDAEPGPMSPGGAYERFYEGVGALVSGSATYEFLLRHGSWPYGAKPYWVLSSRDLPAPDAGEADVRFAKGRIEDVHDDLRGSAGESDLWVVGGGNVASQFADAGLLDEVHLTVVPVVLGEGKPLFDRPPSTNPLQLTGVTTFETGMVELRYEVPGTG